MTSAGTQPAEGPGRWSRLGYRLWDAWDSRIDPWRLRRRFPELWEYDSRSRELQANLRPVYEDYVSSISTPDSAISLELSALVLIFCHLRRPRRILDLGSGFSSWVFHYYQAEAQPRPEIWSLDDNSHWLEQTRSFLSKYQLPPTHLENWHDFTHGQHAPFDFILHDLGSMSLRQAALPRVIALADSGALIILDDMQKLPYGLYARQLLRKMHLKRYNLKFLTRDRFHRHAFLVLT